MATEHTNRMKFIFIIYLILLSITTSPVKAQPDSTNFDTRGNDFWLVFPPNFHNGKYFEQDFYYDDSLYIFITSDRPTIGTIDYVDLNGNTFRRNFSIPDPSKIYIFSVFYPDFELLGFNDSGSDFNYRNNSEVITKQYFHITSDNDVTVYAHNQAHTTSDACLVLPTDILGKDYFVMSYNSDGEPGYSNDFGPGSTPSQFVVMATEDNTNVIIKPKDRTMYNDFQTQTIMMNKGEVYLVQAGITNNSLRTDLTGSEVHSNKPVAVFAGHQRSTLPNFVNHGTTSRDYLLEQMPPIQTWGQNALLIPYQQPVNVSQLENDIYRILAGNDNTEIYINNVFVDRLNKGEFYEGILINPAHVRASASILVAQFKKTSNFSYTSSGYFPGDPFEMLIPPVEQFMNQYRIINTQAFERDNSDIVYTEQFIIIVATDSTMASVLLDGNPIQLSYFKPIPTTKFFYANVRVGDGVHTISCNNKIGVYVYGYGEANSYGYVGGMSMKPYDFSPPQIASDDTCYSIKGTISDTLVSDSKISSIISPVESQINVTVKIDNFNPYAQIVNFSSKLNNFYEDGEFEITATDSMGLYSTKKYEIPGFTLSVVNFRNGTRLPEHDSLYRIKDEFCYPVTIENYGKHNQKINSLNLKNNSNFRILYNTPKTLNPGQIDTALICFSSQVDTNFIDTLSITGECGIRKIQAFNLVFRGDTSKPDIQVNLDPCNKEANLLVSDSTIFDFGLESVNVIDTINCNFTREKFYPRFEKLKFTVINPYKDAVYHIVATDSAGFVTDIIDTIQGFTIEFPEITLNGNLFDFDSTLISVLKCDSVKIKNTGLLPITFDNNLIMNKNILFSLPLSQLPLTVKAGDSMMIILCFSPVKTDENPFVDTLQFEFNCLFMKIVLTGLAEPFIENLKTKCNIPVKISLSEIPGTNFLGQNYPNPASGLSKIKFGIAEESNAQIRIYDLYGKLRESIFSDILVSGEYEVEFSTDNLEQGIYIYTLQTGTFMTSKSMSIRK